MVPQGTKTQLIHNFAHNKLKEYGFDDETLVSRTNDTGEFRLRTASSKNI